MKTAMINLQCIGSQYRRGADPPLQPVFDLHIAVGETRRTVLAATMANTLERGQAILAELAEATNGFDEVAPLETNWQEIDNGWFRDAMNQLGGKLRSHATTLIIEGAQVS